MEYKESGAEYGEIELGFIKRLINKGKNSQNDIILQEEEEETFGEEEEFDISLDDTKGIFESNDDKMITKVLRVFARKCNDMNIEYSEDFYEKGFLYHIVTLLSSENIEIQKNAIDITASFVQNKKYIRDFLKIDIFNIFLYLFEHVPEDEMQCVHVLVYALDVVGCFVEESDDFRSSFIEKKGIGILYGIVQSHKNRYIIKAVHRLLEKIASDVFDEDDVIEIFTLYAKIFDETYKISTKSAFDFVACIAGMDDFYDVFSKEGTINVFIDYLVKGGYSLMDKTLIICCLFANNDPFIFIPAFPRLVKFLEVEDQESEIIYAVCALLKRIFPFYINFSPEDEEEETDEHGNRIPLPGPIIDETKELNDGEEPNLIGLMQDTFMTRIGKALIPKFQTMDFLYAKHCVFFFFEILKNSSVEICEELASEGVIPLLIRFLETENNLIMKETLNALEYLFDLEETNNGTHGLLEEFCNEEGVSRVEELTECEEEELQAKASAMMEYITKNTED